jgi:hypothetical protein
VVVLVTHSCCWCCWQMLATSLPKQPRLLLGLMVAIGMLRRGLEMCMRIPGDQLEACLSTVGLA